MSTRNAYMIKIANQILKLFGRYIKYYEKINGPADGIVWIRYDRTGEVMIHAKDFKRLEEFVKEDKVVREHFS